MQGGTEHGSINLSGDLYGLDDGAIPSTASQCRCDTAKTVTSANSGSATWPLSRQVQTPAPMHTPRDAIDLRSAPSLARGSFPFLGQLQYFLCTDIEQYSAIAFNFDKVQ